MDCILTLKGQMSHRVELGKDARGNLTRIDNVLNAIPARLNSQKVYLENLYAQMEAAKTELGKPFPQEEELRVKSARLAELNAELNIDDKMPMERFSGDTDAVAKSTRPSILQKLRAPLPEQTNLKSKHKITATPKKHLSLPSKKQKKSISQHKTKKGAPRRGERSNAAHAGSLPPCCRHSRLTIVRRGCV